MVKGKDLIGQKFNMLTVIKRVENSKHNKVRFLCKCDCGNETVVDATYLRSGRIKSCGCFKNIEKGKEVNIGDVFGRLTVIDKHGKDKYGNILFLCKCDCGNETIVTANNLRKGHTRSCGCFQQEQRHHISYIHGMKNTRLYNIWTNMKQRCNNSNSQVYNLYGGRGIKVCEEWNEDFLKFYEWAIKSDYNENLEIDRINVNGNYEPLNCRWVDKYTQANNKRNNHYITINEETKTLAEWCRIYNIHNSTYYDRIKRGYSEEEAITKNKT